MIEIEPGYKISWMENGKQEWGVVRQTMTSGWLSCQLIYVEGRNIPIDSRRIEQVLGGINKKGEGHDSL